MTSFLVVLWIAVPGDGRKHALKPMKENPRVPDVRAQ
jgi:hypothetical protein